MTNILDISISHPLEREYEAWITYGIEQYFAHVNIDAAIWAISPRDEKTWPADIGVAYPAKLLGLQIKRPLIQFAKYPGGASFDTMKWSLSNPKGQSSLVLSNPDIYYCLPSFINRSYRNEALTHCIFWRPIAPAPTVVWYNNPRARNAPKVSDEMRWGLFVEKMLSCSIGSLIVNSELLIQFFRRLNPPRKSVDSRISTEDGGEFDDSNSYNTYLLAIHLKT